MNIIARIIVIVFTIVERSINPFIGYWTRVQQRTIPPITNDLLNISAVELAAKIRRRELKSETVVRAYIERIHEVEPILNAVVDVRFEAAIEEAKMADQACSDGSRSVDELAKLFPLLGVPFTVKESVGIKGLSQVVGSVYRHGMKADDDGMAVKLLKAKGAIPLLCSANPEFCLSWETNTLGKGRCNNPYDLRRTCGGSSGGEGALNSTGASVFGIGSDLSGSIRIPGLFNGIFAHKPTGGLISLEGHFPSCGDKNFGQYLQIGPLTRFPEDLPLLLDIIAGENASKLSAPIPLSNAKIFYLNDKDRPTISVPIQKDIKDTIEKALKYFEKNGSRIETLKIEEFANDIEITGAVLLSIEDSPQVLKNPDKEVAHTSPMLEFARHLWGKPKHSMTAIFFQALLDASNIFPQSVKDYYIRQNESLKSKLNETLGTNGVLFYPTFNRPAFFHHTSPVHTFGTSLSGIFNMIGFPATHIPMGLNAEGLPVGFQVVAAPYQDRLCFQIANELKQAFGGWVPPSSPNVLG